MNESMITFGSVASRRLGSSLGINNISPKVCTYSCVYCQVGRTLQLESELLCFFAPAAIHTQATPCSGGRMFDRPWPGPIGSP